MREREKKKSRGGISLMLAPSAVVATFALCLGIGWMGGRETGAAWQTAPIAIALAATLAAAVMPTVALGAGSVFGRGRDGDRHTFGEGLIRLITVTVTALAAVWVGVAMLGEGTAFVTEAMGIDADEMIVAAVLLGGAAYISDKGDVAIKGLGLAAVFFTVVSSLCILLLALLVGSPADGFLRMTSVSEDVKGLTAAEVLEVFLRVFAPSAVGGVWLASLNRRDERVLSGGSAVGVALSGGILLIAFLTVVSALGGGYGFLTDLPYMTAVGSLTAGKLFMRPEGLVYLSYVWLILLSLAVCISASRLVLADKYRTKKLTAPVAAAVMLVAYRFLG